MRNEVTQELVHAQHDAEGERNILGLAQELNKNSIVIVIVIVIFLQGIHSVKLIFSGALHIHTNMHITHI